MFTQTFALQNYLPAISAEQAGKMQEQMAVVDGRNFAWRANGVFSAYGGSTAGHPGSYGQHMRHSFMKRVQNVLYHFMNNGVWTWTGTSWLRVFSFAVREWPGNTWALDQYKWTYAYVGTRHWFCHPQVGLVYYDQFDDEWGTFWDDCWNGPPYAITQADNRLVMLLEDVVVWSEFDKGDSFPHMWQSGSGAQSLALIRYGQPYTVMPYANGWITFTSMGIMQSRPTYDQAQHPEGDKLTFGALVFHHDEVTFEDLPIGPTAITHVDERQVIWLARTGFQVYEPSQGGGWGTNNPWEVAMGKFYAESYLPAHAVTTDRDKFGDIAMMEWLPEFKAVVVSVKATLAETEYACAHVFQMDMERWGSLDVSHNCFGPPKDDTFQFSWRRAANAWENIDHRAFRTSWVMLSPTRLQLPQEPEASEDMLISVQSIRLGIGKRVDEMSPPALGLVSNWRAPKRAAEVVNKFNVLISGGWDVETTNVDQHQYATLVTRGARSAYYACDVTGVTHTIVFECSDVGDFFQVSHVELGFFMAGRK